MIKKQITGLILLCLMSIPQNNLAMKHEKPEHGFVCQGSATNDKHQPEKKKRKRSREKEQEHIIVIPKLWQLNDLPHELKVLILYFGMRIIIGTNYAYNSLHMVKEYLNTLSLVNLEFMKIAQCLGWCNNIIPGIDEPIYKITAKLLLVSQELRNQSPEDLNKQLISHLNAFNKPKQTHLSLYLAQYNAGKDLDRAARLLIAGACMDYETVVKVILKSKCLHDLVPILILKRANFMHRADLETTALMDVVSSPAILKKLIEYYYKDPSHSLDEINLKDNKSESALDKAIINHAPESVALLLACHVIAIDIINDALRYLMNIYDSYDRELTCDENTTKSHQQIAILLILAGADIDQITDEMWHPRINKGWLMEVKKNFEHEAEVKALQFVNDCLN